MQLWENLRVDFVSFAYCWLGDIVARMVVRELPPMESLRIMVSLEFL